jgi:ribose-phosphate pyrophosphokinase
MSGNIRIFSGNSNLALSVAICRQLGITLGDADVFEFSNENVFVRLNETVREQDVFVVQSFSSPVSKSILEMLIMIDTVKRASAARITAVIPYFAYGRTDKKDQPRVPITARLLADMISVAGSHRVLALDLHAGQIEGFFNIPVDHLSMLATLSRHFVERGLVDEDTVVVATDLGGAKKARNFAERVGAPLAVIEKRRVANDSNSEVLNVIGHVRDRRCIIVDDEIDTAGSLIGTTSALEQAGAADIYACCTHPVLSGPAIDRIRESNIVEIVVTDTIPLPEYKRLDRITVLSTAPLIAQAIQRIHSGGSVGALFR